MLAALDRFSTTLERLRAAVDAGDPEAIEAELRRASTARRKLDPAAPRRRGAA